MKTIINYYQGSSLILDDDPSHFVSRIISSGTVWDKTQIDLVIEKFSGPDKVFVEVGVDIGSWIVVLPKFFKNGYGFEPSARYEMAKKSLELSNATNVEIYNMAVSDENGFCNIGGAYNHIIGKNDDGNIPTVTLDSFIKDRVDFLKIDTEGHEYYVLKGAENILKTYSPVIYLETHRILEQEIEDFLIGLGYTDVVSYDQINKFWVKTVC